jgi:hypothetical protein
MYDNTPILKMSNLIQVGSEVNGESSEISEADMELYDITKKE